MKKEPLVSIAIVTWNRKDELLNAINSCFRQTYKNFEIVIVDNDSKDGTFEIITDKYPQIKIIKMPYNLGCPVGRNIALANCNGGIIFSLDDDGYLDEYCIQNIVNNFLENNKLGILSCNIIEFGKENIDNKDIKCQVSIFTGCAFAIKKILLDDIGFFPDYFRQMEETYLALKALDKEYEILFDSKCIMYHKPSLLGRNNYKEIFYNFKHDLLNIRKLISIKYSIFILFYKCFSHFKVYYRKRYFIRYFIDLIIIFPLLFKEYKDEKVKITTFIKFRKLRNGYNLKIK